MNPPPPTSSSPSAIRLDSSASPSSPSSVASSHPRHDILLLTQQLTDLNSAISRYMRRTVALEGEVKRLSDDKQLQLFFAAAIPFSGDEKDFEGWLHYSMAAFTQHGYSDVVNNKIPGIGHRTSRDDSQADDPLAGCSDEEKKFIADNKDEWESNRHRSGQAFAFTLKCLSGPTLDRISRIPFDNAYEAMKILKETYHRSSDDDSVAVQLKIYSSIKQGKEEGATEYSERIVSQGAILHGMGRPTSLIEQKAMLMRGLKKGGEVGGYHESTSTVNIFTTPIEKIIADLISLEHSHKREGQRASGESVMAVTKSSMRKDRRAKEKEWYEAERANRLHHRAMAVRELASKELMKIILYLDTGSSVHCVQDLSSLSYTIQQEGGSIITADNNKVYSPTTGCMAILTLNGGSVRLNRVIHHPSLGYNLLSASALEEQFGATIHISRGKVVVKSKGGVDMFEGVREGQLYRIEVVPTAVQTAPPPYVQHFTDCTMMMAGDKPPSTNPLATITDIAVDASIAAGIAARPPPPSRSEEELAAQRAQQEKDHASHVEEEEKKAKMNNEQATGSKDDSRTPNEYTNTRLAKRSGPMIPKKKSAATAATAAAAAAAAAAATAADEEMEEEEAEEGDSTDDDAAAEDYTPDEEEVSALRKEYEYFTDTKTTDGVNSEGAVKASTNIDNIGNVFGNDKVWSSHHLRGVWSNRYDPDTTVDQRCLLGEISPREANDFLLEAVKQYDQAVLRESGQPAKKAAKPKKRSKNDIRHKEAEFEQAKAKELNSTVATFNNDPIGMLQAMNEVNARFEKLKARYRKGEEVDINDADSDEDDGISPATAAIYKEQCEQRLIAIIGSRWNGHYTCQSILYGRTSYRCNMRYYRPPANSTNAQPPGSRAIPERPYDHCTALVHQRYKDDGSLNKSNKICHESTHIGQGELCLIHSERINNMRVVQLTDGGMAIVSIRTIQSSAATYADRVAQRSNDQFMNEQKKFVFARWNNYQKELADNEGKPRACAQIKIKYAQAGGAKVRSSVHESVTPPHEVFKNMLFALNADNHDNVIGNITGDIFAARRGSNMRVYNDDGEVLDVNGNAVSDPASFKKGGGVLALSAVDPGSNKIGYDQYEDLPARSRFHFHIGEIEVKDDGGQKVPSLTNSVGTYDVYMDAKRIDSSIGRHIQHSDKPNCRLVHRISYNNEATLNIVAIEEIPAGTMLTADLSEGSREAQLADSAYYRYIDEYIPCRVSPAIEDFDEWDEYKSIPRLSRQHGDVVEQLGTKPRKNKGTAARKRHPNPPLSPSREGQDSPPPAGAASSSSSAPSASEQKKKKEDDNLLTRELSKMKAEHEKSIESKRKSLEAERKDREEKSAKGEVTLYPTRNRGAAALRSLSEDSLSNASLVNAAISSLQIINEEKSELVKKEDRRHYKKMKQLMAEARAVRYTYNIHKLKPSLPDIEKFDAFTYSDDDHPVTRDAYRAQVKAIITDETREAEFMRARKAYCDHILDSTNAEGKVKRPGVDDVNANIGKYLHDVSKIVEVRRAEMTGLEHKLLAATCNSDLSEIELNQAEIDTIEDDLGAGVVEAYVVTRRYNVIDGSDTWTEWYCNKINASDKADDIRLRAQYNVLIRATTKADGEVQRMWNKEVHDIEMEDDSYFGKVVFPARRDELKSEKQLLISTAKLNRDYFMHRMLEDHETKHRTIPAQGEVLYEATARNGNKDILRVISVDDLASRNKVITDDEEQYGVAMERWHCDSGTAPPDPQQVDEMHDWLNQAILHGTGRESVDSRTKRMSHRDKHPTMIGSRRIQGDKPGDKPNEKELSNAEYIKEGGEYDQDLAAQRREAARLEGGDDEEMVPVDDEVAKATTAAPIVDDEVKANTIAPHDDVDMTSSQSSQGQPAGTESSGTQPSAGSEVPASASMAPTALLARAELIGMIVPSMLDSDNPTRRYINRRALELGLETTEQQEERLRREIEAGDVD